MFIYNDLRLKHNLIILQIYLAFNKKANDEPGRQVSVILQIIEKY